jgi:putative PEP-CTERM system TPR-repeat lipoprotein
MPSRLWTLCSLLLALTVTVGCTGKSSEEHIATAEGYIAESRFELATIELKNATQKDINSAKARWLLGQNYLITGDVDSAVKELLYAQQLNWNLDDVLPALATALLAQGEYVRVSNLSGSDLSPLSRADLMATQALSEFTQGETERANALIEQALELAPTALNTQVARAKIFFAQQDFSGALTATQKALAESPTSGEAWSVRGDLYMQEGKYDDAVKAYSKAIKNLKFSPINRLKRALIHLQLREYEGALADAEMLLRGAPANVGGNYVKGVLEYQSGQYPAALRSLSIAEPAWRKFPLVLFLLGSANLMQDNLEQANIYATRFYNAFPDNVAGLKLLGMIQLKQRKFSEVQALLSPVVDKYPEDVDALALLANALLFNNRVDEGIVVLEKVAQLQPGSASARIRLGTGLILGGQNEAANKELETALDLDPQYEQAGVLLVLNHLQSGSHQAAIDAASTYQQRHPNSPVSYNLLGRTYLQSGQLDNAREAFEKAVSVNPADPSANHQLARMALADDDPAEARRYYQSVLAQDTYNLPTLMQLALLDAKAGNKQAVVEKMELAMTAHPAALEPRLLLGRYYLAVGKPELLPPLFATLDQNQRRSHKVMMLLALSQISDSDNIGAKYTLEEMLRSTPETPEAYHLLAMAAAGEGDTAGARESLESALHLSAQFLPSRLALARMDLAEMAVDDFLNHLNILVNLAPESADVLQLRAAAAAIDKNQKQAQAFSRKAFEVAPATHTALELAHYLNAAGDSRSANDVMREWVTENPADLVARLSFGTQLRVAGLMEEYVAEYEAILKVDQNSIAALTELSLALRQSEPKRSLTLAQKASKLAPNAASVLDALALAEYANRDYLKAELSIRRAIMNDPENPDYRYHNALILSAQGNTADASALLEKLLREETNFTEYDAAVRLLDELRNRGS